MLTIRLSSALCILVLCVAAQPAVHADPPDYDYIIEYRIREDPSDEQSDVTWILQAWLLEDDSDTDSIGWDVVRIQIIEVGQDGASDVVWIDDSPTLTTQDGLWWVDHADLDDPQASEFDTPPVLEGTAEPVDSAVCDLGYEFESGTMPPEGPTYGGDVAAVVFRFEDLELQQPKKEGTNQRTQIIRIIRPPQG